MGRLSGFSARSVERVAEAEGWTFLRQRGSHRIYGKPGAKKRLVIPNKVNIGEGLMRDLVAVLEMTVDEFIAKARK